MLSSSLPRRGVDEVGEVGHFRSGDDELPVGADAHALRLRPDADFARDLAALEVEEGHRAMVLVGDIGGAAVGADGEALRIGARGVARHAIERVHVPRLDAVGVAGGDIEAFCDQARRPYRGGGGRLRAAPRCARWHRPARVTWPVASFETNTVSFDGCECRLHEATRSAAATSWSRRMARFSAKAWHR